MTVSDLKPILGKIKGEILWSEPLSRHTTFRVGGPADVLFYPKNVSELATVFSRVVQYQIPYFILGQGSNLLFPDEGFQGVIFNLSHFDGIEILERDSKAVRIKVQAGIDKKRLLNWTIERGFSGLEFLSGVPGQIGGGLFMNAGCFGDFSKIAEKICLMNEAAKIEELPIRSCDFSYRSQSFCKNKIIIASVFRLNYEKKEILKARVQKLLDDRKEKQPFGYPSCGSTFKNPPDTLAGRLIETAGCKGYRVGDAEVSKKHANFIINHGHATSRDILAIIDYVKKRVKETHSVELEEEVIVVQSRRTKAETV
ncbi:MAG: UDP-N-acetylmuramate dehydrogenase [Deltaproteobacteria bacterium]